MFVFLNSTYKVISIKQHFPINKYLYGRDIGYKYVSVREYMVYYLSLL